MGKRLEVFRLGYITAMWLLKISVNYTKLMAAEKKQKKHQKLLPIRRVIIWYKWCAANDSRIDFVPLQRAHNQFIWHGFG